MKLGHFLFLVLPGVVVKDALGLSLPSFAKAFTPQSTQSLSGNTRKPYDFSGSRHCHFGHTGARRDVSQRAVEPFGLASSEHLETVRPDDATALQAAEAWCAAVERALLDRRRVDEVVGSFAYDGLVKTEGREYKGQGAVKRFLTDLIGRDDGLSVAFSGMAAASSQGEGTVELTMVLTNPAKSPAAVVVSTLALTFGAPGSGGLPSLDTLVVEEDPAATAAASADFEASAAAAVASEEGAGPAATPAAAAAAAAAADAGGEAADGPLWETDDGRVVQKIWQHEGCFEPGNPYLVEKMQLTTGRLIVIIDAKVQALYGEKIEAWCESMGLELAAIVRPGDEDQKTMDNCLAMIEALADVDPLRRSEPVLAIGGGVLTDVAGMACALWRRGVPWCRMPTTLLGMVDASVGIKVAVNLHRKNGVGHFFSPTHTFIDSSFLPTVSQADIRSGVGEVMKAALVHDKRLFDLMQAHGKELIASNFKSSPVADAVIKFSVDTMLQCIGPDLWEESLLRPMDFGHSFSRTLETTEEFKLRHGEAVAIDCVMSTMIAKQQGLVSTEEAQAVLDLYAELKLPCSIRGITAETYKRAVREITVHRDGILRAPLPRGIGACAYTDEITDEEVDAAFGELEAFMALHPDTYWDPSKSFAADRGH